MRQPSKKNIVDNLAERRANGVRNLIGRGWSKALIAADVKISTDNLRMLVTPGRGTRSQGGVRLDFYLEQNEAFNENATYGPGDRHQRASMVKEESRNYSAGRMVNLPSLEQFEDAMYLAHRSGDPDAIKPLHALEVRILDARKLCDDIGRDFETAYSHLREKR